MASNYSCCDLGKRCVKKTADNRVFTKYTLVCAMNSKGIINTDYMKYTYEEKAHTKINKKFSTKEDL